MKRKILAFLGAIVLGAGVVNMGLLVSSVSAAGSCNPSFLGLKPWYDQLTTGSDCHLNQDKFKESELPNTIVTIVLTVLWDLMYVVGVLAVVYGIYSGYLMITSAGDVGKTEKAKKSLTRAVIGLAIAVLATTIVGVVKAILYK